MNPQPPEYVGQLFAIWFVLMVVFYAIKACLSGKSINFSDRIIIGYIDDPLDKVNCTINLVQAKTKKNKPTTSTTSTTTTASGTTPTPPPSFQPPKQLKEQATNNNDTNQLYHDCVEALRSLGLTKSASKKRVNEIFNSNHPSNIQEFLILAFRK